MFLTFIALNTLHESKEHSLSLADTWIMQTERFFPAPIKNIVTKLVQRHNKFSLWNDDVQHRLVWGYVDRHSIKPGETFNVLLSTDPVDKPQHGHIEIFRVGFYGHTDRMKVWTSESLAIQEHPVAFTASAIGPGWPIYVSNVPTTTWTSGYYTIDFVDLEGNCDKDIAYLIVSPGQLNGDILVKLSTNTYQAYNSWGGSSLYLSQNFEHHSNIVAFDRPTRSQFFNWEYYYVLWLEELAKELNLSVHYVTDFDIHMNSEYTEQYPLFISVGHDEYWSKEEFSNIHHRIFDIGKNTLFLGANTAFNQIRFVDVNSTLSTSFEGRQMVFYRHNVDPISVKRTQDPILDLTGRFSKNNRRSEIMLTGVTFESWFPYDGKTSYPFHVAIDPLTHPLFEGTGYTVGLSIGNILGYEWDNTDPSPQKDRFWDEGRAKIPFLPKEKLVVLFSGEPIDAKGKRGKAEAVYFISDAGAKVFSSGTIQWPWGLTKEGFKQNAFRKFNQNLIEFFLKKNTP